MILTDLNIKTEMHRSSRTLQDVKYNKMNRSANSEGALEDRAMCESS